MAKPTQIVAPKKWLRVGGTLWVHWQGVTYSFSLSPKPSSTSATDTVTVDGRLCAPMPANVLLIECKAKDTVEKGQRLAVLEAMKMEYPLHAPYRGRVQKIHQHPGAKVALGDPIIEMEPCPK